MLPNGNTSLRRRPGLSGENVRSFRGISSECARILTPAFCLHPEVWLPQLLIVIGITTVNQRQLAEFTVLVAAQAPLLIEGTSPISDGPLWVYWQYSKSMLSRWRRIVDDAVSQPHSEQSDSLLQIASDILTSELLTRVWGAVLVACDERQRVRRSGPIAQSVLTAHQQSRASVLRMLVHSSALPIDQLADLDRLRRRVERWTDVLVGPLVVRYGDRLASFAFDPRRARDFGEGENQTRFQSTSQPAWSFLLAGIRTAFSHQEPANSPHNDPLLPMMRSVLATFPSGTFQSEGPIKSLLMTRVSRSSERPESAPMFNSESSRTWRHDVARPSQSASGHSSRPSGN